MFEWALLAIVGYGVVVGLVPALAYNAYKKSVKKKNQKIRENVEKENQEKVDEEVKRARQMTESKSDSLTFYEFDINGRPIENPSLMNLKVTQSAHVTPENSTIFKGKVRVVDLRNGGVEINKDMYFYFPDLYVGDKKIPVKPNLSTCGHLVDEAPYLIKSGKDGKYYTTIVPLAEAYSGIEFDFIKDSKVGPNLSKVEASQKKLSDYISVELVRDAADDFIPVDFSDPVQKKAYEDYLAGMRAKDAREKGSAFKEVQQLILKAGESLGISKGEDPEKYVTPLVEMTSSYQSAPDASMVVDSSTPQNGYYNQFQYIPRGSNFYRMGLYGINNGSNSLNSSAQADDPYAFYKQFRYIPEGSVLDRIMDGNVQNPPHGTGPMGPRPHGPHRHH